MEKAWKGWIIDESVKNLEVLSKLNVLSEKTEENTEGGTTRVWKLYTVEVADKDITKISKLFEKQIKPEYYAHFTNIKKLLIVFHKKSFVIRLKGIGEEKEFGITSFEAEPEDLPIWKTAFEYGTTKGKVDPRYFITVK